MHVQISCRKNYIRTSGVLSSSAEVSYRKTRTSSGGLTVSTVAVFTYRERKEN